MHCKDAPLLCAPQAATYQHCDAHERQALLQLAGRKARLALEVASLLTYRAAARRPADATQQPGSQVSR